MFDGGRPRPKQIGTTVGDHPHFLKPFVGPADTTLFFDPLAQCDRDRAGHGVAGQAGEFACKLAGFVVLDVESHGSHPSRRSSMRLPYALACGESMTTSMQKRTSSADREAPPGLSRNRMTPLPIMVG